MSIDANVFAVMSGHAPLTALLGSGSAFRMFPSVIAQDVPFPAAAYAIRTDTVQTLDGVVAFYQTRVVVECWAQGIAEAKSVADAVVGAFAAAVVPLQSRDGRYDVEIGLHVETVEFDWWS